ncbi:MAG: hypothetical protein P1U57_12470 [Oleibacter sp.]|nr:hypothetical protein [Thalassolituus sp.]
MESLVNYPLMWTAYFLAGIVAFWCWGQMAVKSVNKGLRYHIYSAVGAVIIFTPVPFSSAMPHILAPGFIAFPFTLLSGDVAMVGTQVGWYLLAAFLALIPIATATYLGRFNRSIKHSTQADKAKQPTARQKFNPSAAKSLSAKRLSGNPPSGNASTAASPRKRSSSRTV